jgi:hypothetical protein
MKKTNLSEMDCCANERRGKTKLLSVRTPKIYDVRSIRRTRIRVSPLQSKGMLIVLLVVISESINFTKAVQFWSTVQENGFSEPNRQQKRVFESRCQSTDTSCPSTPPTNGRIPPIQRTFGLISNRISSFVSRMSAQNCCSEFEKCISKIKTANLQECAIIPRGGHSSTTAAVDAAADLVTSKMPYNIPLNGWKVIFQAFLTTLNVVCWLVPLQSKKISDNKLALSLANAFSGGVFLSLAFGHLIPECVHGFEGMNYNEVTPYLLVLSGYLLIFFVEKVAFDAHEILHEMEHAQDHKVGENGCNATTNASNTGATSGRSALILLGALAVHSILEMAALGLAGSFSDSAILTLSIALHQVRRLHHLLLLQFIVAWYPHKLASCLMSRSLLRYQSTACRVHRIVSCIFKVGHAKRTNNSVLIHF